MTRHLEAEPLLDEVFVSLLAMTLEHRRFVLGLFDPRGRYIGPVPIGWLCRSVCDNLPVGWEKP